ncbi:MAG: BACON domain-containing protein, partial [Bacteroides sp.]|nr:BACON domain-containing protein [Bacteroides sp.]
MKKFLFLLTGLMFMLASCGGGEDDNTDPTPTPKPNEPAASITMSTNIPSGGLAFDVNGGEKSVSFTTNKDWTVTVAATTGGTTWCTASPASGSQGDATVKFSVKENTDYDDRSVSVTIKAGTATKTFTINQKGADALLVTTKKYEVAQEGGEIEVEVQANIDYEMEISETAKSWITEATTRALTTHKHTFT